MRWTSVIFKCTVLDKNNLCIYNNNNNNNNFKYIGANLN